MVFFDLGDVVCDFVPSERLDALGGITGKVITELQRELWDSGFSSACDEGKHTADEMYAKIRAVCGEQLSEIEIRNTWSKAFRLNRDVLAVAQNVAQVTQVGLLTNNAPILRDALSESLPEIDALFDPILFSYEFGVTKPNESLFVQVERMTSLSGSQMMLIDDSTKNIEAAKKRGWQTILFENVETLKLGLDQSGLQL